MVAKKVLITGIAGCIGSWIAKHLTDDNHEVIGVDLSSNFARHELLDITGRFPVHQIDVRDTKALDDLVQAEKPNAFIHLASFLMPQCKSNPMMCVDINVASFMSVLEWARRDGFSVVYASSAWVNAPTKRTAPITEEDDVDPQSLYGVFKFANEGMAKIYAKDYGVQSTGFRPYIVYGPGRDNGLTADVSQALVAAGKGTNFKIGFGGDVALHHASDVARAFIMTALHPRTSGHVYNLRGSVMAMSDVVTTINDVTNSNGLVSFEDKPLPIAANLSDDAFQKDYGPFSYLDLEQGMRETLKTYQQT